MLGLCSLIGARSRLYTFMPSTWAPPQVRFDFVNDRVGPCGRALGPTCTAVCQNPSLCHATYDALFVHWQRWGGGVGMVGGMQQAKALNEPSDHRQSSKAASIPVSSPRFFSKNCTTQGESLFLPHARPPCYVQVVSHLSQPACTLPCAVCPGTTGCKYHEGMSERRANFGSVPFWGIFFSRLCETSGQLRGARRSVLACGSHGMPCRGVM